MGRSSRNSLDNFEVSALALLIACPVLAVMATVILRGNPTIAFAVTSSAVFAGGVFTLVRWINRRGRQKIKPPSDPPDSTAP